jgi:hypothetical protein
MAPPLAAVQLMEAAFSDNNAAVAGRDGPAITNWVQAILKRNADDCDCRAGDVERRANGGGSAGKAATAIENSGIRGWRPTDDKRRKTANFDTRLVENAGAEEHEGRAETMNRIRDGFAGRSEITRGQVSASCGVDRNRNCGCP